MPTLLAIEASPRFEKSTSRKLTAVFVEKWRAANPDGPVIVRDLVKTVLPFVDLPWIGGAFTPPAGLFNAAGWAALRPPCCIQGAR
jgi:FMN-dependent NADH-azoreductase